MPLRPNLSKSKSAAVPAASVPADGAVPAGPDLEYHLQTFWEKYSNVILIACCVVILAIVGRGAWDYLAAQKEEGIQKEFSDAATPALQRSFIAAHPDHPLAGVAELQAGDAAYAANQMPDAIAGYSQAADILKTGPLAARAQLGLAMAKIQSGQTAEGEATLGQLANDPQGFLPVRTEAAYHLASIAAAAGRAAELRKLSTQLMQIAPDSPWTERAFALQAQQSASSLGQPGIIAPR